MRFVRILAAISAALFAAACLPTTTKTPIGASAATAPDPALYGVWRGQSDENSASGYMSFLGDDDGAMTAVLVSLPYGTDPGDWEVYRVRAATLGSKHYMTASEIYVKGQPAPAGDGIANVVILYRIDGRKLTLYTLDTKAVIAAIKRGELKGVIGEGDDPDVQITSDEPELDAFFAKADPSAYFTNKLVALTKVE
jgi:hypothetical protein